MEWIDVIAHSHIFIYQPIDYLGEGEYPPKVPGSIIISVTGEFSPIFEYQYS